MGELISYRAANADDVPTICELGQVLNAVHHAARPDIMGTPLPLNRDADEHSDGPWFSGDDK